MFSGTLRENIDPFVRYSDAAVAKALRDCGLEGRSLDAVVGVSGENFSLGEKQLVRHCSASTWHHHQQQQPSLLFDLTVHTGVPGARVAAAAPLCLHSTRLIQLSIKQPKCCFSRFWRRSSKKPQLVHCAPSRDLAQVQDAY